MCCQCSHRSHWIISSKLSGVALWGGKPQRKFFSSQHLRRWTDQLQPKICFIVALCKMITSSSAVLLKSQCLRGNISGWIPAPLAADFNWHRHTSCFSRLPRTLECPTRLYWIPLASYLIRHCLNPKDRAGKCENVSSDEYYRMSTRDRATTCIGFRASRGRLRFVDFLQVQWLSAFKIMLLNLVFWERDDVCSNFLCCDMFAHLTEEIFVCPSCRLKR